MSSFYRIIFVAYVLLALPLVAGESKVTAPKPAIQLAEAYVDSLPAAQQPKDRADTIDDFLRTFFHGYTHTSGMMTGGTEADRQGFKAGQEYRRANPGKLRETMEGFGYTATEAMGVWTVDFEHTGFRPRDRPQESWWLEGMEGTESDLPKDTPIPKEGVSVRIIGFLSPASGFGYGHLNQYKREFYATKISKLNGG